MPRIVSEGRVDLVMMGSYGGRSGNVDKIFFGSTAEAVVRTAGADSHPSAVIHGESITRE
jgi:nucleotide-binding universal stress UspA family protein